MTDTAATPWQFGIRHLLGAMFVVALISALVAPWARGWSAGQWLALGMQSGVVAVSFILCLAVGTWSRRRIARRLGMVLFAVTARTWGPTPWTRANAYGMIAFATIILLLVAVSTIVSGGKVEATVFQGVYVGVFAAMGVMQLQFPPDRLLVGENGVVIGSGFSPWEIIWCAYQPEHRSAPLFLKTPGWAYEVFATAEIEQPLAKFLRQRAKLWENPPPRWKKVATPQ